MASSGIFSTTFREGYAGYSLRISWKINSQSSTNNTSSVTASVQLASLGSAYQIISIYQKYGSLTINGVTYDFTFSAELEPNQTKTLFTKTVTIAHNINGTRDCSFSTTCGILAELGGELVNDVTASGTATFNTIPRASTISSITASVDVDGTNTVGVGINRLSPSFIHTVVFKFGSYSYTATNVTTATSYAIPMTWLNAIPSATSGQATATLTTYYGTSKIGSSTSRTFTITVPYSVVPSITSVAVTETVAGINEQFQGYVQNKSRIGFTMLATGPYGSTVTAYRTLFEGVTYHGQSITTGLVTASGSNTATLTVTDSRGRTASTTRTFNVLEYSNPTIISFTGTRALQDGTENYEGEYLKSLTNYSISPCNNRNTATAVLQYKVQSASTWTTMDSGTAYSMNEIYVSSSAAISADNPYNVRLTISDFFTTVTHDIEIGTAFTLIDYRNTGRGIAFGKVSEKNAFECSLPMYDSTGVLIRNGVSFYESGGITDPDTTTEQLILTSTNTPQGGAFYYIMTVCYQSRNSNRAQIAIPYNQATGIYFRTCFNGAWSQWLQ